MTDAGEKLRQRAIALLKERSGDDYTLGLIYLLTDFASAELERAAGIAEQCECGRGGCSCEDHAAAIRKLKE